jgi:large subunit ribosomal protein L18
MKLNSIQRRKFRTRARFKKDASGRLRLSVHRSPKHIHVQVIDDIKGITVASASTTEEAVKKGLKNTGNVEAAKKVGAEIGKRALAAKVETVVFDRGSFRYHGRIKALAEAAREAGLKF